MWRTLVWCSQLIVVTLCLRYTTGANYIYGHEDPSTNLLNGTNNDFEEPVLGSEWRAETATVARDNSSAYTNTWSVKASNRQNHYSGFRRQIYSLVAETNYYYSIFVKFLSVPTDGLPYQPALKYKFKFPAAATQSAVMGQPVITPLMTNKWIHFSGTFKTPVEAFTYLELYVNNVPIEVDLMYDTVALQEIPSDSNWKQNAADAITQIRQNVLTLQGSVPPPHKHQDITIYVNQTRHEFGFGASIHVNTFNGNDTHDQNYQDFFYKHFERTTTTNALKWDIMEKTKGDIDYESADTAIATLQSAGIPCHGHNLFWDKLDKQPAWVQGKTGDDLVAELERRINYFVPHYKGKIDHLDVLNEDLPHTYYGDATGNYAIIKDIFNNISAIDSDTDLFINEYTVVTATGKHMSPLNEHVRYLVGESVKLDGIGLQNHHTFMPDPEVLKKRLDFVGQNELPIHISELSMVEPNVTKRADYIEDFLYAFFSHSSVQGITAWGFSDLHQPLADQSFADGDNVTSNAVGDRWYNLVKVEWRTNQAVTPPKKNNFEISFPAFHGSYAMSVYDQNTLIACSKFDLPSGADKTVTVPFS